MTDKIFLYVVVLLAALSLLLWLVVATKFFITRRMFRKEELLKKRFNAISNMFYCVNIEYIDSNNTDNIADWLRKKRILNEENFKNTKIQIENIHAYAANFKIVKFKQCFIVAQNSIFDLEKDTQTINELESKYFSFINNDDEIKNNINLLINQAMNIFEKNYIFLSKHKEISERINSIEKTNNEFGKMKKIIKEAYTKIRKDINDLYEKLFNILLNKQMLQTILNLESIIRELFKSRPKTNYYTKIISDFSEFKKSFQKKPYDDHKKIFEKIIEKYNILIAKIKKDDIENESSNFKIKSKILMKNFDILRDLTHTTHKLGIYYKDGSEIKNCLNKIISISDNIINNKSTINYITIKTNDLVNDLNNLKELVKDVESKINDRNILLKNFVNLSFTYSRLKEKEKLSLFAQKSYNNILHDIKIGKDIDMLEFKGVSKLLKREIIFELHEENLKKLSSETIIYLNNKNIKPENKELFKKAKELFKKEKYKDSMIQLIELLQKEKNTR